jgi:hypothetical protein
VLLVYLHFHTLRYVVTLQTENPPDPTTADDPQTRFRRLPERAAINVTEAVMNKCSIYFCLPNDGDSEHACSSCRRVPTGVPDPPLAQVALAEKNISVGDIFAGTDTTKSIILEAFEDGNPGLLKITTKESIDHEMGV